MAKSSLGSLVVSLGLEAAEFVAGLTKAEYDAKKFQKTLEKGVADAAKGAGIALGVMAAAASAAFVAVDQLAKQAGNFQDLAEKTGANAEALASFAVSAAVAGVSIDDVAGATIKLTKNLTGVDDESKAAGAALAALGIPLKEFKALDPAAQMEAVAKAMAGFDDGASKVAVSLALFGKSGAQLLPFLKELAAEGGRQVILTAEQIRQADEYADKQAKLRAEVNLYAQVLAVNALPAINDVTKAGVEFAKSLLGISNESKNLKTAESNVRTFADNVADSFAFVIDAGDGVSRVFEIIARSYAAHVAAINLVAKGQLNEAKAVAEAVKSDVLAILNRPLFSTKLAAERAARQTNDRLNLADTFAGGNQPKGRQLTFSGAEAKATAEKTSEAQRYTDALTKTLEKTQELSAQEQLWLDFSLGRIKGMTGAEFARADAVARQVDQAKAATEAAKEFQKNQAQAAKDRERYNDLIDRSVDNAQRELDAINSGNEQLKQQIIFLQGGQAALDTYTQAQNERAAATKEAAAAEQELFGFTDVAAKLREQAAALRERNKLLTDTKVAESIRDQAKALQDVKNMFADSFANAFADFINGTKSAKDAFKSFAEDILRQINRIAAQQVANMIFGGNTGGDNGGLIINLVGKALGAYFGAAGGGGIGYGAAGSAIPAGPYPYAMGGVSPGGWSMVGEQGPELVKLPAGARVHSSRQSASMMQPPNVVQQFTINGPTNRQTEHQIGLAAARGISSALRNK